MASDLQLCWEGGKLSVLRGAFVDGDVVAAVASALAECWRFHRFTESRWLTVGTSARTLVVALLTGIEGLVATIIRNPRKSKFYLRGFN